MKIKGTNLDDVLNGTNFDDIIIGLKGDDMLFGYLGDDVLKGKGGDDALYGGLGNNKLLGNGGNDTFYDGGGADDYRGGKGIDTVDYSSSSSQVRAYLYTNQSDFGASGDSYKLVENVIGSAYDDFLQAGHAGQAMGGAGDDRIYGGGGFGSTVDGGIIRGDAGYDTLYMQYGNTSAWLQYGQGYDKINGFIEGEDMLFIDLSDFGLGNSFDFNEIRNSNTVTATGTNAQFIYEADANRLWFDDNGTDAGGLTLIAEFVGGNIQDDNLGTNDFEFQL